MVSIAFKRCAKVPTFGPILLVALVATGTRAVCAQSTPDSSRTDTVEVRDSLEPLLDSFAASEQSPNRLSERYAALLENPLDVNRASAPDLSALPGLSLTTAHRIVQHRTDHGPFDDRSGLTEVSGVTEAMVRRVRPFLTVRASNDRSNTRTFPSLRTIGRGLDGSVIQRFVRRLDLGRGYREHEFLGAPGRLTTRLRLHYERRLELGFTVDKDPGEPLRWSPSTDTYGFDHVAGSVALRDLGRLETIVLGNFSAQFGRGVGLWQGIRFGKGRDPLGPVGGSGRGLLPYRSASETRYFRGIGATLRLPGNFRVSAFGSRKRRDATVDSSLNDMGTGGVLPVRTVSGGGRHRTTSELARKGTFRETLFGTALEYQTPSLRIGLVGYRSHFDRPVRPGDTPYRYFRVSGRRTSMLSSYVTAHVDDYVLFGEAARSPAGTVGGLVGAAFDGGDTAQAVLVGRHYPANFPNFHGSAFGDSGGAQNESGVYAGIQLRMTPDWNVRAYFDQYRFPWIRFGIGQPSVGWEARVVVEYEPRPWLTGYVQVRAQSDEEGRDRRDSGGRFVEGLQRENRRSARLHVEYRYSDAVTLRTRLEGAQHRSANATSKGVYLSQGLRFHPTSSVQIDARVALFDTDGYSARIYAYEHDLLYSFSVPVFFDRGRRSYIVVEYAPTTTVTVEAKYGIIRYDNRYSIGSGLNRIDGSRRREFGLQMRWEF